MFASVVWPRGRPPSDKPKCGYNDELCDWLVNGKSNTLSYSPSETSNYTDVFLKIHHTLRPELTTVVIYCLAGTQTSPSWLCL